MKFQIQYTDIPVLLADKHKIDNFQWYYKYKLAQLDYVFFSRV